MKKHFTSFLLKYAIALFVLFNFTALNVDAAFSPIAKKQSLSKDSVIKILAIGNSFSDDAVEHYLYGLAKAGGYKVIIGNMYIGGCSLERHLDNANNNKAAYNYRKIDVNGEKTKTPKVSLETALADENWDYISLQQNSGNSGLFNTYQDYLPQLFNYVKSKAKNPKVKYIWHQTWAYSTDHKNKVYEKNYQSNQQLMYGMIMTASKQVKNIIPNVLLVPSGTAIQNARTSFVGDKLTRDGYHLNLYVGRYVASCTWYETIFGNVIGNTYVPDKVSRNEAEMAQHAANAAVKKSFKVTNLKKFKTDK